VIKLRSGARSRKPRYIRDQGRCDQCDKMKGDEGIYGKDCTTKAWDIIAGGYEAETNGATASPLPSANVDCVRVQVGGMLSRSRVKRAVRRDVALGWSARWRGHSDG
jgi:hypothetical protein